jgi:hypothetical protein
VVKDQQHVLHEGKWNWGKLKQGMWVLGAGTGDQQWPLSLSGYKLPLCLGALDSESIKTLQ